MLRTPGTLPCPWSSPVASLSWSAWSQLPTSPAPQQHHLPHHGDSTPHDALSRLSRAWDRLGRCFFSIAPSPAIIPMLWDHPSCKDAMEASPAALLQPPLAVLPMSPWSVKYEAANLAGLAAWTPCPILIFCMLQGAGDCGQAAPLLLAGQSLGDPREAVGTLSRIRWLW